MFRYNSLQHGILEFKTFKRAQKHFDFFFFYDCRRKKIVIENITLVTQLNVNPTAWNLIVMHTVDDLTYE